MSTATYFRIGRIVYRTSDNGRRVRIATADSSFRAALTVRALIRTNGGHLGDWREHLAA